MNVHHNRRDFLRWAAGSAAAALGGVRPLADRAAGAAEPAKPRRPNIVFILTDDQRHDAMGCAGHPC
jgi:hypothetical protein